MKYIHSWSHVASTDFCDSLTPFVPISPRSRHVFQTTSCFRTGLLWVSSCWSANTNTSLWRGIWENVTYEFVLASLAVSHMSCSSYLDGFRDRRRVAVQLLFRGMLLPWFVKYSSKHFWALPSIFFSICFVSIHVVHPYSRTDTTEAWKKFRFILTGGSDFNMIHSL